MTVTAALDAGSIRQRAYELWERNGRPEAREIHYWLRAEAELAAEGLSSGCLPAAGEGPLPRLVHDLAQQLRPGEKVGA